MCNLATSYLYIAIVFVSAGIPVIVGQQSKCENNKLLSNGAVWKCTEINKCLFTSRIPAKIKVLCGVQSICCPEPPSKSTNAGTRSTMIPVTSIANSVALRECQKNQGYRFHNYTKIGVLIDEPTEEKSELDCFQEIEPLVIDGKGVPEKEFPFMALLTFYDEVENERNWLCGGTLISERFILSAAHCTKIGTNTMVKWALLGKLLRTGITKDLRYKNLFKIVRRINHPQYKAGNSDYEDYDIALYKLETAVPLSSYIRPICLYHDSTKPNVGSKVTVAGWGVTDPGGVESESLQKAPIYILEKSRCIEQFKTDSSLRNGFDESTMICGGDLKSTKDSCAGDSGGPMLVAIENYTCMYLQVGIVSRGSIECGRSKGALYTRVSYFLPWIQSIVWPSA